MPTNPPIEPRLFPGVTISSTFTDLKQHREALITTIKAHGLTDIAMENDAAKFMDVIDSSLQMVRDGSAYVGIISKKYGQIPPDPIRNPDNLSITELEFNEALERGRPILLFIMSRDHLVHEDDIEPDPGKKEQLKAFIERAKKMGADSKVHRVYAEFDSLDKFKEKIGPSIASIRRYLDEHAKATLNAIVIPTEVLALLLDPIPKPPTLYAEPAYIGSHTFVGRDAQLEALNDWARPADSHTILLFEAIGGNGKSMLTWEWTTKHATNVRKDWAGIFWYSFYEKGAIMADFCRRALAYMTGRPLDEFQKKKTPELKELLLHQLNDRPWLLILDGLERVLVAYHRIDAAEIPDEELNTPTDKIVNRNPCSCIHTDDDDLLRSLASAAPSKLLVSSRLVPRVLVNAANQPIPGVQRILLPGLRPTDAEKLFRSCGITGNSEEIQRYLTTNCDCHPLTIGVLAGLVNNYLPDKGNFDAWVADLSEGGQLNLADLDLIQKRNHILKAALHVLSEKNRQLLSTLALLSEAVDYQTISAFNPHLPPEPDKVTEPKKPELGKYWKIESDSENAHLQQQYEADLKQWKAYQKAQERWRYSIEYRNAPKELTKTIRDLEQRGLLQYDHNTKRYDLHPVVRGVAVGSLKPEEIEQHGQRVVDYFSAQVHNPYEEAETIDDIRYGLNIVQTQLKMWHYQEACDNYRGDLASALFFNLEAYTEILSLLRPFFPNGWGILPTELDENDGSYLAHIAALALTNIGESEEGLKATNLSILCDLNVLNLNYLQIALANASKNLNSQNHFAAGKRMIDFALLLVAIDEDDKSLFADRLDMFENLSRFGQWTAAKDMWNLLDPMSRNWTRTIYRPGRAEYCYAQFRFFEGDFREEYLIHAEKLATEGKNRSIIRDIHKLRGAWRMEQGEWQLAVESLNEAVRMVRVVGQSDSDSETWLALAKFHLNQLSDPLEEAERLTQLNSGSRSLAELWFAIGNLAQAKVHALKAYRWAWADGEPYVYRYELNKTTELLNRMGVEVPNLSPYDPAKEEKFPWEDQIEALIEKLKAEKAKKDELSSEDDL
ncbi:DUF4062 domain-containing protein [Spirosoma sp. HMF4905]|uniref:DUF4062 domain-containing protein n=1 Tax=Spirosoma arboris TaxID=2682092 RepID=A0A7K1SCG2_9BACT|nr:DUF4062 domain-containing protein [Spirosoma arboris]MVM31465.1 DUF4062 domain-containing protein [Spirosoma arboris]